jgi:recombinational DNA repair protein (RecF pathway)
MIDKIRCNVGGARFLALPDHCLRCKKKLSEKSPAVSYERNGKMVIYCSAKCDPTATADELKLWEYLQLKRKRS